MGWSLQSLASASMKNIRQTNDICMLARQIHYSLTDMSLVKRAKDHKYDGSVWKTYKDIWNRAYRRGAPSTRRTTSDPTAAGPGRVRNEREGAMTNNSAALRMDLSGFSLQPATRPEDHLFDSYCLIKRYHSTEIFSFSFPQRPSNRTSHRSDPRGKNNQGRKDSLAKVPSGWSR